jgi:threonine/homoserine/homoserine lactone efflux protein
MLGTHDLLLFIAAGLLLNITPGPDTLYIVGRSTTQGLRAGVIAALGIGAGIMMHIAAAALGLSAILATSAAAFTFVKLAGAAYLLYVGVSLILQSKRAGAAVAAGLPSAPMRTVFAQGFLTNVLNPKVALFFLAFLPQFVDAQAPAKPLAFLFLGVIFNVNGTLWNLFVAWSSVRLARGVMRSGATARWMNRCLGALFVYLAAKLAIERQA